MSQPTTTTTAVPPDCAKCGFPIHENPVIWWPVNVGGVEQHKPHHKGCLPQRGQCGLCGGRRDIASNAPSVHRCVCDD